MTAYVLSERAQADIDEIWDYSADTWSVAQAELYVGEIRAAIETLAGDPERGRRHDSVRSGYRRWPVGSHVLFYRVTPGQIQIVRILHKAMNHDRHL